VDRDFFDAAIQEPTTILGIRLRPFSLGHLVILQRLKSAFVTEGETMTIHDLALSVLVCSLPYKDGCALFNRTDLPQFFKRWHQSLSGGVLVKLGLKSPIPINYALKVKEFAEYIGRGSKVPCYSYDPGKFASMECPSVQIVKVTLMRDMHIPEAELMDRPWAVCLWDFVTLRALAGQIQMVDSDEIQKAKEAGERLAEALRKRGVNVGA
jgi:hypothetical protein